MTDLPISATTTADPRADRVPWSVMITGLLTAIMIIGGFALLAVVPVALTMIITARHRQLRPLRWWAGALAAVYAAGLVVWALRSDPAPSLTKDLHPVHAGLIVVVALATVVRWVIIRRSLRKGD